MYDIILGLILLNPMRNMTNNAIERMLLYAIGRGKVIVKKTRQGKKMKSVYIDLKFGANLLFSELFNTDNGIFLKNNFLLIHLHGQ